MTGESNVLVAYFSLTNNRVYTADEMDAVSSASLKIEDGTGYGHAELLALAAQEVTGGDVFPIKVSDLYPETYPELIGRFGDFCFPPGYGGAALNPVKRGDYSHCRMDSFQKGGEERPGSGIAYRVTTRRFLCLKY